MLENETIQQPLFANSNNQLLITTKSDDELQLVARWDSNTEYVFIFVLSILSIPTNFLLIIFYAYKIVCYKRYNKHFAPKLNYVYAANCFHTYLIEICSFDTIISIHLFVNTIFQLLYNHEKTAYESVFDISHFTCKFFIYALRISSAMSSWLTFLLTFNRSMLLFRLRSNSLCINTKYLTLFLFCICTIANVFRLELLYINSHEQQNQHQQQQQLQLFLQQHQFTMFDNQTLNDTLNAIYNVITYRECGVNTLQLTYSISDATNAVFWSLIAYNLIFSITPACANLVLSIYLIKKHSDLKRKLILNHLNSIISLNKQTQNAKKLDNDAATADDDDEITPTTLLNNTINKQTEINIHINEFYAEFLQTCMPCIAISCTHVLCYLPYTLLETLNQIMTNLVLFKCTIYINYLRYLFHGCKFYLLLLVSYKFRKDFFNFYSFKCKSFKNKEAKNNEDNEEIIRKECNSRRNSTSSKHNFSTLQTNLNENETIELINKINNK